MLAERVLTKQIGSYGYIFSDGPTLVQATFPDNQQRLSWAYVVVLDAGGFTLLGDAAIVYLDALTGEPLALVSNLTVGDPQMVCSSNFVLAPVALLWPVVFLYVCGLAVLLAVVAVVRVLRRRK